MGDEGPDMVNRDPNNLNDNLQVMFDDVFGEPEGAHSPDCAWTCSYKCYECGKGLCYKLLAYFCSWPMALCWGSEFACIAFYHIWLVTPYLRVFTICCATGQKFFGSIVSCLVAPICETVGLMFSKINVTQQSG